MDKEKRREYDRLRYLENRKEVLARNTSWRETHREHIREHTKQYDASHRELRNAAQKRYAERNPEKRRARIMVHHALYFGILTKSEVCSECGGSDRIESHHEDYWKPLDVEWLCKKCHTKRGKGA